MAESTGTTTFPISIEAFKRLDPRQKMIGLAGVALLLALLIGGWLWTREPPYALLFAIQDEKDGGQIVAALSQQNVPYRIGDNGRSILVPQALVHETRLRLASQGLPKGGLVGFELMETQKLGVSQFAEQVNYQRALEGELARSVQSLAAVRGARVHLAIPKQSAFLRDDQKASASVLVSLYPGRTLEPAQVAGVVNLVASSVPQLSPQNVSVIDQDGHLISQPRDPTRDAGLDPTQLKFVREVEADYARRIEAILAPVMGQNNVRAQVTADLDFSQTDQVAETFQPNPTPNTTIRSQQTAESGTGSPPAVGIPGALTNQPPVPATAPLTQPAVPGVATAGTAANGSQNYSRNATINYEVDKTVRHTKGVPGAVRRLSVAVVVNYRKDPSKPKAVPLTAAELQQITELTREAMGFSKERGDTLSIANAAFTPAEKGVVADAPLWANPELISILKEIARYLLIAGVAYWLWTRLLKPVFEKLMEPAPRLAPEKSDFEIGADGMLHRHRGYDEKLSDARELAKKDPKAVANIIKEWVDGGEPGK